MACALPLSLFALGLADAQSRTGPTLVRHDFTESAQGWRVSGDTEAAEPIFALERAVTPAVASPGSMKPWAKPGTFVLRPPCCSNCPPR